MKKYENSAEVYKRKLESMDEILHQISLMDQVSEETELMKMIPALLEALGKYTDAENVYMYEWDSEECDKFSNTLEWCKEGVKPRNCNLKPVPAKYLSGWKNEFKKGKAIIIVDREKIKEVAPYGYELMKKRGIRTEIAVPIFASHKLTGFIGVDNPNLDDGELSMKLLTDVGGHLGSVRQNLKLISALEQKQKKIEEALASQILNNEIISAIGKMYWLIYRMDLQTDTYEEVASGDRIHSLTGKTGRSSELFGKKVLDKIAPEYRQAMQEFLDISTLAERLKSKETISHEYLSTEGNWHQGRFIVKKCDTDGTVTNVLYVVREINEQKKKELEYQKQLMKIAEEAKRANIAKTDFLRRMSHDIRTPINGIRGIVDIGDYFAQDLEKQRECRAKIRDASGYLLDLVNNILDMNKLESGEIRLEEKSFDLKKLLQEADEIIEVQGKECGLSYSSDYGDIRHQSLKGSPVHLRQILLNILGNAVKYNKEGGYIRVCCRETSCQNGRAVFEWICEDNGYGMSEEFQTHMFEPFAQENIEVRTKYAGTGLGLAITKELVEHMGGRISVESRMNQGTKFYVTLSFKTDEEQTESPETVSQTDSVSLQGKRALLVEDNDMNMEIAEFLLQNEGIIVTKAWNGREATEIFKSSAPGTFDMIFMDIMMPEMNGIEATKIIRTMERKDAQTIPIFAMTANAFIDDIERSKAAGMNEHFTKPLDMKAICSTIKKY